jgi:chemotaxis protein MotB
LSAVEEEEEGGGGGWLVSFADLMTLLFAAFVVLYGITPQGETQEILGVASSIRESFVEVPDEVDQKDMKGPTFQGKFIFKEVTRTTPMNPYMKKFNREKTILPNKDLDLDQVDILFNKLKQMGEGLSKSLRQGTAVEIHEFGVSLSFIGDVFFQPGKVELAQEGVAEIQKYAEVLKGTSKQIYVEGHTDSYPSKGRFNNMEIAALRAATVRNILVDAGVEQDRVLTSANGALKTVSRGKKAEDRAKNRRVVIKIVYDETTNK